MSSGTKIEWTDTTWNPVTGCTPISEGCDHCYARRMARRLAGRCGYPGGDGFAVTFHEDRIDEPYRRRKPRRIFVCSMADIFHDDVKDDWLYEVFNVIATTPRHIFQVLTKRPERMRECALGWTVDNNGNGPIRNLWLGVTAENQRRADERIPLLLQTPAAVRFVSVEPMLGPVDLKPWITDLEHAGRVDHSGIHWVIVGGETGPRARPCRVEWVRSIRNQCLEAGIPFFFKGWGDWVHCDQMSEANYVTADKRGLTGPGADPYLHIGKKYTGRLLDSGHWDEFPKGGAK